jgi:hypothetical protein
VVKSGRGWYSSALCKDEEAKVFMSHDPEGIAKAKSICRDCTVKVQCKKQYFFIDCVAGGTTLYERLVESWKRIEDETESNWR